MTTPPPTFQLVDSNATPAGELFIQKYLEDTTYTPSLVTVLATVPPRKVKSDKQLLGVLQRVMMRGFQHDLEFPAISRMTCNSDFTHTTVTMNIMLDSTGTTQDVTIQLPQPLVQLRDLQDPVPLYVQFANDTINLIAKEL